MLPKHRQDMLKDSIPEWLKGYFAKVLCIARGGSSPFTVEIINMHTAT